MNTGPGEQNNYYNFSLKDSHGRTPLKQAADDIEWLSQRFVKPRGFSGACSILKRYRTVLLAAPPGSGRTATAKALLWQLRPDADGIHKLPPSLGRAEEEEGTSTLDFSLISDGDRMWLDLSGDNGPHWNSAQYHLSTLRAIAQERSAYLVIILPDHCTDLAVEFNRYQIEISRPSESQVLDRHLRAENTIPPDPLPNIPFLDETHSLYDISRYAQLVTEARKNDDRGTFLSWCDSAAKVFNGLEEDVAVWVSERDTGPERALILTTAMLHGAHPDTIHHATATLLQTVKYPDDPRSILERSGIGSRLKKINARIDASGGVRFQSLGYASAIPKHFWTHMPELRMAIQEWIGTIVKSPDLGRDRRHEVITRFTGLLLNERYRGNLVALIEKWTERPDNLHRTEAAALVLQHCLQDEQHGSFFRRKVYDWSSRNNLPNGLAQTIIVACRDQIVVNHPDQAVVRLHHMARRERGSRACMALAELIGSDRRCLQYLLHRITSPELRRLPVDADLFLRVAVPDMFTNLRRHDRAPIDQKLVREHVETAWSLAFSYIPYDVWATRAREWLVLAGEDERHRDALLDVLVAGGAEQTSVLARLFDMTRDRPLRESIRELLLWKIDIAQGLAFS
ncbi:hypothetical protein Sme01_55370 [Sphaerisporangium melleum]|uniref:AAA+ ATPase domain-containing protein n=1 Tax=Sphaerisporangium melleum TaxID=321316 RepID=A0A917RRY6_9ACTN|nr:hypothetical protein [Sphaerisporangium melleum]GGL20526.1 hypothetical protein GCM10007964_73080 [Sphaerisporangium melleum]GII73061.1 hypothetical protein Sme01_55370 [Sphaerisporangium melleum]